MTETGASRRVVVTGMGAVAPGGQSAVALWDAVRNGRSAISQLSDVGPQDLPGVLPPQLGAEIQDFDHKARLKHLERDKILPYAERYSWLAAAAAEEAARQSGLIFPTTSPERVAAVVGSAFGGQTTVQTASRDHFITRMKATHPLILIRLIPSSAAAHVGIEYGAKGPVLATTSACASADHAIGLGRDYIRHGLADVALVGGTDSAFTLAIMMAMHGANLLSPDGCRPFAADRNGTVLGEGAGILVLESLEHARARGANVLAEIAGFGMTASATDMVTPDPEAAAEAMRRALGDARLVPSRIDHMNAWGFGTVVGDRMETAAIKAAFGAHARQIGISATKPVHGYAMGATGAIETILTIKAMQDGFMPPTVGLERADPECDLDVVGHSGRARAIGYAMTTTLALGGFNTAIVIGPPPA